MFSTALKTFSALIERDMAVFWPGWKDRFINAFIWGGMTLLVFEYIMPSTGLQSYGKFIAVGNAASWGFFEVTENMSRLMADLEGDRSISYYLSLPIPQWAIFVRMAITNALQAMFISVFFLPLFKLMLGDGLPLDHFSWIKFLIIFLLIHLFYGFFSLFLASCIESLDKMGNVWMRIVFPLWYLGGYQFSWQALYTVSPAIAYCNLLNPIVYVMEGMRAAVLGQEGSLPFWGSVVALIFFTVVTGWIGICRLRKRLDCL